MKKKYFTEEEKALVQAIKNAKYRKEHPEYFDNWVKSHPENRRKTNRKCLLKTQYGLTIEQYEAMLESQGGKCALFEICGSLVPGGNGPWKIDHTHFPKEVWKAMSPEEKRTHVRGLLCNTCNANRVGDHTIESALAVARYLGWKP